MKDLRIAHYAEADSSKRRQLEDQAWRELRDISDENCKTMPLEDVIAYLRTWTYFSTYWENGFEGQKTSHSAAVLVPKFRRTGGSKRSFTSTTNCESLPRRSAVDEILE